MNYILMINVLSVLIAWSLPLVIQRAWLALYIPYGQLNCRTINLEIKILVNHNFTDKFCKFFICNNICQNFRLLILLLLLFSYPSFNISAISKLQQSNLNFENRSEMCSQGTKSYSRPQVHHIHQYITQAHS